MHSSWMLRAHICICGQCKREASESQLFRTFSECHCSYIDRQVSLSIPVISQGHSAYSLENTRKWRGSICWYFKPNTSRNELITLPCKPVPHPVISSCTSSVSHPSQKPGITLDSIFSLTTLSNKHHVLSTTKPAHFCPLSSLLSVFQVRPPSSLNWIAVKPPRWFYLLPSILTLAARWPF